MLELVLKDGKKIYGTTVKELSAKIELELVATEERIKKLEEKLKRLKKRRQELRRAIKVASTEGSVDRQP
ncbi:MAG: hypothetical protein QME68_09005, partial [Elusimicrobiota bacterium]|nr:hypothetical protein [Elusimicrobiota bacterium]